LGQRRLGVAEHGQRVTGEQADPDVVGVSAVMTASPSAGAGFLDSRPGTSPRAASSAYRPDVTASSWAAAAVMARPPRSASTAAIVVSSRVAISASDHTGT